MKSRLIISASALGFALAAALVACGGGGGSNSTGSAAIPPPASPLRSLTVSLELPGNSTQSSARRPQYLSTNTNSVSIAISSVNGITPNPLPTPAIFNLSTCPVPTPPVSTRSCSFTVNVPAATSVVLAISAYASTNGTGTPLSTGITSPVDTTLPKPVFHVSLGGVPASVAFLLGTSSTPATSTSIATTLPVLLDVVALDASNATIIGTTPFSTPMTLAVTGDPKHDLTLSSTTINAPLISPLTLTYAPASLGTQLTSVSITASVGASQIGSLTVNPLNVITAVSGLTTLNIGGSPVSFTVQEYGNSSPFTIAGPGSIATASCAPTSCAPSTSGGPVVITVSPASATGANGTGTLTISDATGTSLGENVIVTGPTTGGITVPPTLPIREYQVPTTASSPTSLAIGPTGSSIWFVESATGKVGKLFVSQCTPTNCPMADKSLQGSVVPTGIATGTDGNIWVTTTAGSAQGSIQQVLITSTCASSLSLTCTVSTPISFVSAIGTQLPEFTAITTGSDGNLYYGYQDFYPTNYQSGIGAVVAPLTLASPTSVSTPLPRLSGGTNSNPQSLTIGPDRNIWFTDANGGVGTASCTSVACTATEYVSGFGTNGTHGIVTGPDGYLYVSEGTSNLIARFQPTDCSGITFTCTPPQTIATTGTVLGLAVGPDGNVWFADPVRAGQSGPGGAIGVIELATCPSACLVHEYPTTNAVQSIIRGPDGNMWFTEPSKNAIGEVVLH